MCVSHRIAISVLFALGAAPLPARAAIYSYRPSADAFVTTAGLGSLYPNIADRNFGGAGSRGVSSADWIGAGQTQPRGKAESLIQFSGIAIADPDIQSLSLSLAITKDMSTGSKNLFNKTGHSGYFNVYLLPSDYSWNQGYDAPESAGAAEPSDYGVTYSTLHSDSAYDHKILLQTLFYDYSAQISGAVTQYDLTSSLANSQFLSDLKTGQSFTLLLSPASDSLVCFNFSAYVQNNGTYLNPQEPVIRTSGPILSIVALPEPASLSLFPLAGIFLIRRRAMRQS
jgi:hypothetical protein